MSETSSIVDPFFLMTVGGVLFLGMYFLPSIIAYVRKRNNLTAIITLNTLLGWTFIGWVISLVWALASNAQPTVIIHNHTSAGVDQE